MQEQGFFLKKAAAADTSNFEWQKHVFAEINNDSDSGKEIGIALSKGVSYEKLCQSFQTHSSILIGRTDDRVAETSSRTPDAKPNTKSTTAKSKKATSTSAKPYYWLDRGVATPAYLNDYVSTEKCQLRNYLGSSVKKWFSEIQDSSTNNYQASSSSSSTPTNNEKSNTSTKIFHPFKSTYTGPKIVCFTGKKQFLSLVSSQQSNYTTSSSSSSGEKNANEEAPNSTNFQFGRQQNCKILNWPFPDAEIWVMPSTSGRAVFNTKEERYAPYRRMAERLVELRSVPGSGTAA